MKLFCSIFFLLFLVSLSQIEARKSQGDYWKHVMGDEPIPQAIAYLMVSHQEEGKDPVLRGNSGGSSEMMRVNWDRLIKRDFEARTTAIIYHHHDDDHYDDSWRRLHDGQVDQHGDDKS